MDFFEQVFNYYNPNNKQIFGITNYSNGNNINLYCKYNQINNKLDDSTNFYWDGRHPGSRHIYNYTGGIIGFNQKTYKEHPDIIEVWNCDEGFDEKYILDRGGIDFFNSKNIFWINIKSNDNNDITKYEGLKKNYISNKSILDLDVINEYLINKINNELIYLKKLMSE